MNRLKKSEKTSASALRTVWQLKKNKAAAEGITVTYGAKQGVKLITKKSLLAKEIILKHSKDFNGTLNDSDCRKLAGISRSTFYKYKAELKTEINCQII